MPLVKLPGDLLRRIGTLLDLLGALPDLLYPGL